VRVAVSVTMDRLKEGDDPAAPPRHISGRELLEGIRELAIERFGPLALDVLREWGVRRTEDFGNIVFNLVNAGLLGASDEDSPRDFAGGYDFNEVFVKPFLEPESPPGPLPKIDRD
jgi:uncharacterized repeat protein (TIGR04138 family)